MNQPLTVRSSPNFRALGYAYDLVSELAPVVAAIARRDGNLAKQLSRAVTSVALNLAEAGGRFGADRKHHFRIAYGSLREVNAALEIARRFGDVRDCVATERRDALGAMLYTLARP